MPVSVLRILAKYTNSCGVAIRARLRRRAGVVSALREASYTQDNQAVEELVV